MKFSGKRLKELREGSGMTQKQLAAEVGTSERQLIRYEKGWPVPSDEMLQKMAGCLQKKVDDFFEVENSIPFFETLNHFISSGYKKDGLLYRAIQTTEKITFFFLNGDTTIPLFLQPLNFVLGEYIQ